MNPIALIAMIAGTAYSAYAQYTAAKAQAKVVEYNAALQERNAVIAKQQAAYQADRQAEGMKRLHASQRVAYLSSGVTLEGGTGMDVMLDSTRQGEMDRLAILYSGDIESLNYKAQAAASRLEAQSIKIAGKTQAYATLISGSTKAYGQYELSKTGTDYPIG